MNTKNSTKGSVTRVAKSGNKREPVDRKRWPGVYKYFLGKRYEGRADIAYTITYKDPVSGRKVWEKIGRKSEGITPQLCAEIRSERMRKARHGEEVKTALDIQRDRLNHDRPLGYIADAYFKLKKDELKGYKTDLNRWELHLEPLFKKHRVSSISPIDIQRVKTAMKCKAPATTWNVLELLRRLCNWGSRNRLAPSLPFTIKMPKRDNETIEYLTPEQGRRLDAVMSGWKRRDAVRMIRLAMLTGMRRGEIFGLEDRDLNWRHGLILIRDPKGGKSARIPMVDVVAGVLKRQIKWRDKVYPGSPFVFPGAQGGLRTECTAVRRIKAKAKLPADFRIFHGMRHHFAVTLANSGKVDLSMIGELLTHKSVAMTKRYAAFLPATVRAASELAATLIDQNADTEDQKVIIIDKSAP